MLSAFPVPSIVRTRGQSFRGRQWQRLRPSPRAGGMRLLCLEPHLPEAHSLADSAPGLIILTLSAFWPQAWRLCCCGLPSFDGKASGAPPFAQGGALGLFAVGARLRREACNNTCHWALIQCFRTFSAACWPSGLLPQAGAGSAIRNSPPAVYKFPLLVNGWRPRSRL